MARETIQQRGGIRMPAAFNQGTKAQSILSRASKKWVRLLTVVVYVTIVSIAAVFLAIYYSLIWRPQVTQVAADHVNVDHT